MKFCPNCQERQAQKGGRAAAPYCPKCRFPVLPLAGMYNFDKRLGTGGFGIVYLGRNREDQRAYAIKLLRPELLEQLAAQHIDPEMGEKKKTEILNRFQQEILITTDLSKENPHIVQIFDVGEDPAYGHFYIMEYLQGVTLDRHIREGDALSIPDALHIFEQLCQAVSAAHRHRIVHRDLKPSNIFLLPVANDKYFVKVIDFGIAKSLLAANNMTQTGGVIGSMKYISPEQARGESVDQRADIYSLGCLLYRLLTGTPPFIDEGQTALLLAHLQKQMPSLSTRRPDLTFSPGLDSIMAKALAKKAEDRFDDVESFWQALKLEAIHIAQQNPSVQMPVQPAQHVTLHEGSPEIRALWEEGKKAGYFAMPGPPPTESEALFSDNDDLSFDLPIEDEEDTMMFVPGLTKGLGLGLGKGLGRNANRLSTAVETRPPKVEDFYEQKEEVDVLFIDESDDEELFEEIEYADSDDQMDRTQMIQSTAGRPRFATMPDSPLVRQALFADEDKLTDNDLATNAVRDNPLPTVDASPNETAAEIPFIKTQMDQDGAMAERLREAAAAFEQAEQEEVGDRTMLSTALPQNLLPPRGIDIRKTSPVEAPKHTLNVISPVPPEPQRAESDGHTLGGRPFKANAHGLEAEAHSEPNTNDLRPARNERKTLPTPVSISVSDYQDYVDYDDEEAGTVVSESIGDEELNRPAYNPRPQPEFKSPAPKRSMMPVIFVLVPLLLLVAAASWYFFLHTPHTTPNTKLPARLASKHQTKTKQPPPHKRKKLRKQHKSGTTRSLDGLPDAKLVWIPGGSFVMGSAEGELGRSNTEGPTTKVTISHGFWMWQTEVTQGQYKTVMNNNPSQFQHCGASCPVERVSWYQAAHFANRLSAKFKLQACYDCRMIPKAKGKGKTVRCSLLPKWKNPNDYHKCPGFRLPTEAEWEYAARAESITALYNGPNNTDKKINLGQIKPIAWFNGNSDVRYKGAFRCTEKSNRRRCGTHPVGKKTPNDWKLYDMLGNVWEWVADGFRSSYPGGEIKDPIHATGGQGKIGRGGSWNSAPELIRTANRGRLDPQQAYSSVGFRLVRSEP